MSVAKAIFNEELKVLEVLVDNPCDPHLNGVLRGLGVARDIAERVECESL